MALASLTRSCLLTCLTVFLLIGVREPLQAEEKRPRAVVDPSKVQSVVALRNQTPADIHYQLRWNEGDWKKFTIASGKTKVHWTQGSNRTAAIRFDARFDSGLQQVSLPRPALDFFTDGSTAAKPRRAVEGTLYEFRRSADANGLRLVTVRSLDRSRNSPFRKDLEFSPRFPHLLTNFEVLEPPGKHYNCIAHSMGIHNRWINPQTGPAAWPFGPMDQLYQPLGFHRLPTLDLSLKKGVQKIVLYALKNPDGTIKEVTHAALQEKDGVWSSKLGQLPLIRHITVEALNGPNYGEAVAVYVRNR